MARTHRDESAGPLPEMLPSGGAWLVEIYGPRLGRTFHLPAGPALLGRDNSCDLRVELLDTVSRRHCTIYREGRAHFIHDEHSTNGTFVNNARVESRHPLRNGDLIRAGTAVFKFLAGDCNGTIEAHFHEAIHQLAITDGLTGLANKRLLSDFLEREIARCRRHSRPLSIALFDLDHFKRINDRLGHVAGDQLLHAIAQLLRGLVRREECLARYGGEELCLVLPDASPEDALARGEEFRLACAACAFTIAGQQIRVTLSGGIASLAGDSAPSDLLRIADEQLYQAKRAGRDRIVGAPQRTTFPSTSTTA